MTVKTLFENIDVKKIDKYIDHFEKLGSDCSHLKLNRDGLTSGTLGYDIITIDRKKVYLSCRQK